MSRERVGELTWDRLFAAEDRGDRLERVWAAGERSKWAANAYGQGLADLVRLLIEGHTNGYPVENGETWEPELVDRLRIALEWTPEP